MELRSLKASDMGAVCKIISSIGIKEFKDTFKGINMEEMSAKEVGMAVLFDIVGIVLENIPKAQSDIDKFLASLTGMKVSEIQNMPFVEYTDLITEVITKDDFRDFFAHVMKLFNH